MNIVIIDDDIFDLRRTENPFWKPAVILPFPPQARTEKTQ